MTNSNFVRNDDGRHMSTIGMVVIAVFMLASVSAVVRNIQLAQAGSPVASAVADEIGGGEASGEFAFLDQMGQPNGTR